MQVLVRDADRTVWSYGLNLAPMAGYTLYSVDDPTATAYLAALPSSGGSGCTLTDMAENPDGTWNGAITALAPPTPPTPPSPTVAAGTGTAGARAAFVASAIQPSTDFRGTIDVTIPAGGTPVPDANGHYELARLSFSAALPQAPVDVMTTQPSAASQALGRVFGDGFTTAGFSLLSTNAPAAGSTVRIGYALA